MDDLGSSRRDSRRTWVLAIALIGAIFVAGMPTVQALATKVTAKIKDSSGDKIDAKDIGDLGLFSVPGSDGAVATRTFAGGGGLLGTGGCGQAGGRPNTTTIDANANTIITGLIVTGPAANLAVSAPALDSIIGPGPVVTISTNPNHPNEFIGLGNGLNVSPSPLVFECTGGSGNYVILGQ